MGIHVFIGTKAQYVKTAPLLRLLAERGVPHRLIDSGQHAVLAGRMRAELGVREPDLLLGAGHDIDSIPQALAWSARLAAELASGERVREELFAGSGGVCVVHGDTPSTLLSALLARRAGLEVAHLEAGLRSRSLTYPFPEELIRIAVMRVAQILFAPDATALRNLDEMGLADRAVPLPANTTVEAVAYALGDEPGALGGGEAVVTTHRVENLHRPERVRGVVEIAREVAKEHPTRFLVHGPTRPVLERFGLDRALHEAGVRISGLVPHGDFVRFVHDAPLVVTDGGSIQEECALLGVPTLLWRARTERPDGLGGNVVLSGYDPQVVGSFIADPERYRRPPADLSARPSETILATLLQRLGY